MIWPAPGIPTRYCDVFSREGRHVETVWLPLRVDEYVPPIVREDTLFRVVTDDLDVQYVIRASLRPPPQDASQ